MCWAEAASQYRSHLLLAPDDAAIWVQLGHSLKESGQYNEALNAYRMAAQLCADDADALLHFGHALMVSGDVEGGKAQLRLSAAAGGGQAAQDLFALGVPGVLGEHGENERPSEQMMAPLSVIAPQLRLIDCSDVEVSPGGGLETLSNDPWLVFEWREGACPDTRFAALTVEMECSDDNHLISAQVYADTGEGFSESESVHLSTANGKMVCLLFQPEHIRRLRFDPDQSRQQFTMPQITIEPLANMTAVEKVVRENCTSDPEQLLALLFAGYAGDNEKRLALSSLVSLNFHFDYPNWLMLNANPGENDYRLMKEMAEQFPIRPFFSFIMPTYNTPIDLLRECIDTMLAQSYDNFEICLADDNSPNPDVVAVLAEYADKYAQVKYIARKNNGHISESSNSALSLATGDYVVLVDHDDLIPDYTLFVLAYYINLHPDADVVFSDEDKVTVHGQRLAPYFKGEFNKYLMYGHNMVSHLGVYRRALIQEIGGFRHGLEGSQDYDLLLRCLERSSEERIIHVPHVLYHWRIIPGSTAMSADQKSYAITAAQNTINGHFERMGMPLRSVDGFAPGCTAVKPSRLFDTSISIIIPTRNGLDVLKPCIDSIFERPAENIEIIIVDNGSHDPEALAYLDKLTKHNNIRVIKDPGEFNFSRINNMAAAHARGEILCFLNNDTEVISGDWLNRARAFLSMKEVGMVGARLLFPDGALQHFGIVLGMGHHGIAGVPYLGSDANSPGYFGKARLLQEVSAVTAACMFVRKADLMRWAALRSNYGCPITTSICA
jgi:glycosyltransferase involved in cell wall biosynthesis